MNKKSPRAFEAYIIREVPKHPTDIVTRTAEHFGVSRQTAHKHVKKLVAAGTIGQSGKKRGARYFLAVDKELRILIKLETGLAEDEVWKKYVEPRCVDFPANVRRILEYGFTEMVNNVIDHSEGGGFFVSFKIENGQIKLGIGDDGIGIFKKIQMALHLPHPREAILHLSKGKFTTDAKRHSGEGIFFTSRAFDAFSVVADGLSYCRFDDDWLVTSEVPKGGTVVLMYLALNATRNLAEVFRQYTNVETHHFDRTQVVVELGKNPGEQYISRSQAKRIILGLEKFKRVVLDFKGVSSVGQGFVDEVFRVFKNAHSGIEVTYVHANDDVEFMLKRSLS